MGAKLRRRLVDEEDDYRHRKERNAGRKCDCGGEPRGFSRAPQIAQIVAESIRRRFCLQPRRITVVGDADAAGRPVTFTTKRSHADEPAVCGHHTAPQNVLTKDTERIAAVSGVQSATQPFPAGWLGCETPDHRVYARAKKGVLFQGGRGSRTHVEPGGTAGPGRGLEFFQTAPI